MSLISRLFFFKGAKLNIEASKEAIRELERLTETTNARESEIRSCEEMLRTASDDMEYPMWGKNRDGRFVFLNTACAAMILKTPVQEALNQTDADLVHDALAQVCMYGDMVVMLSGASHRFIEHARYADGSDMWLDTVKSPWIIAGSLVGTVGVGRVITNVVPEDVREKYAEAGSIEIDINLMYNRNDIRMMMEGIV